MTMPKGWQNKNKAKQDPPASNRPKRDDYPDDKSYEDAVMQYIQSQGQSENNICRRQEPTDEQLRQLELVRPGATTPAADEQLIWQRNLTKGF
jgi:hypothetical protein